MYNNNSKTQHKESEKLDKYSGLREKIKKHLRNQRANQFVFW